MVRYIRAANDVLKVDHDGGPGKGKYLNDVFWDYEEDEAAHGVTYTIPYGIITIRSNAFFECESIETINMPDTVFDIRNSAFAMCVNLKTINFSKNLVDIGISTFAGCTRLKDIKFPDSLEFIGHGAFYECKGIRYITIPRGVKQIDKYAFGKCTNLQSIEFESLDTRLVQHVFEDCTSIRTIKFPNLALDVSYTDGVSNFTDAIQRCMYIIRDRNHKGVLSLLMDGFPFALDLIFELAKKDDAADQFIYDNRDKLLEYASEYNRTDMKVRLLDMMQDNFNNGGSVRL